MLDEVQLQGRRYQVAEGEPVRQGGTSVDRRFISHTAVQEAAGESAADHPTQLEVCHLLGSCQEETLPASRLFVRSLRGGNSHLEVDGPEPRLVIVIAVIVACVMDVMSSDSVVWSAAGSLKKFTYGFHEIM